MHASPGECQEHAIETDAFTKHLGLGLTRSPCCKRRRQIFLSLIAHSFSPRFQECEKINELTASCAYKAGGKTGTETIVKSLSPSTCVFFAVLKRRELKK